jgi:hypothetical protein
MIVHPTAGVSSAYATPSDPGLQMTAYLLQRLVRRAPRSVPIRAIQEIRLKDRLRDHQGCHLHYPVAYRRNPQRPQLPIGLRNVNALHRVRLGRFQHIHPGDPVVQRVKPELRFLTRSARLILVTDKRGRKPELMRQISAQHDPVPEGCDRDAGPVRGHRIDCRHLDLLGGRCVGPSELAPSASPRKFKHPRGLKRHHTSRIGANKR